ncbi:Fc Receptor-Like Protein 6 [Manis pentadactyla]|nr:Fc Receptor-Like Protein 6 [Manis pentadactyla]
MGPPSVAEHIKRTNTGKTGCSEQRSERSEYARACVSACPCARAPSYAGIPRTSSHLTEACGSPVTWLPASCLSLSFEGGALLLHLRMSLAASLAPSPLKGWDPMAGEECVIT